MSTTRKTKTETTPVVASNIFDKCNVIWIIVIVIIQLIFIIIAHQSTIQYHRPAILHYIDQLPFETRSEADRIAVGGADDAG
jgi:hypothetical protein